LLEERDQIADSGLAGLRTATIAFAGVPESKTLAAVGDSGLARLDVIELDCKGEE
jgi:hypothetical protein